MMFRDLELEEELAGRRAALDVRVRPSGLGERVDIVDAHVDLARGDEVKELAGVAL